MIQTYLPLYRKYRPQAFADLVGQAAISQTLTNAIQLGRVAHAYLFCGPRGTGKTSSARIFAKSLNCEQGPTPTPCQTCASCLGITNGQALDVIEFDAASNNGVEDARELIESCQFAPMAGRYKIYIIDEVHMLSTQAFNTLLKTLEEPPPNVVFIFATTEAHKVLPTIVSRCQRFDFSRITQQDLVTHLDTIAARESISLTPDAVTLVAKAAKGGLRDALSLLDQVSVIYQTEAVTADAVRQLIGMLGPDALFTLTEAIGQAHIGPLMTQLATLTAEGLEPAQLLRELTQHWRNLMLYATAPDVLAGDDVQTYRYAEQMAWFTADDYPLLLHQLAALDRQLKHTNQPQLWLEVGLVGIAYRDQIQTVRRLNERLDALEARLSGTVTLPSPTPGVQPPLAVLSSATAASQPSARPRSSPFDHETTEPQPQRANTQSVNPVVVQAVTQPAAVSLTQDFRLLWQTICDRVASPPTKSLLKQHTFLKSMDDKRLIIGCASDPTLMLLKKPDKLIHLQRAVSQHFGSDRQLELVLDKMTDPNVTPAASSPPVTVAPVSAPVTNATPAPNSIRVESPLSPLPVEEDSLAEEAPPLEDIPEPSGYDLGRTREAAPLPTVEIAPAVVATVSAHSSEDLAASKQYVVQLLQGKPLD